MTEIKGQLLSIILVIAIFGVVAGALIGIFSTLTKSVEDKVSQEIVDMDSLTLSKEESHRLEYLHY